MSRKYRSEFKEKYPRSRRKYEAERILSKYPDRIPIICERASGTSIPNINQKKFIVPCDLTLGQFVYVVRKRIKLTPEKAIFIFVGNVLHSTSAVVSKLYEDYKEEDGFLYVTYSGENSFGAMF